MPELSSSSSAAATPAVYRGHLLHITGSPARSSVAEHLVSVPDGALVVGTTGRIDWSGSLAELPEQFATLPVLGDPNSYLLPGFVDTHLHFPQTYLVNAHGGGQLPEWLDRCIFPGETRLAEPEFAARAAADFVRARVRNGTTAAMVFGSAFPHAQDALFAESLRVGLRTVSGRGVQTIGPPSAAALISDDTTALALVSEEIERWHGAGDGLAQVAVVPRFSLSVTPRMMGLLGELYEQVRERGVYFHSHLNENDRPGDGEIAAVLGSYQVESYLDTYDGRFLPGSRQGGPSLLGRRSILAHAVHCQDRELARLAETGTSIAHCPTSQLFLGSGTMPWRRTVAAGVNVAIGTDIGAGDEWLIPRVLNDTYKVHLSEPGEASVSLHPAELLFAGTLAGARALDQEAEFGNLDAGKEADFLIVDVSRNPSLAANLAHLASDTRQRGSEAMLFALLMGMRAEVIAEVFVRGRRLVLD